MISFSCFIESRSISLFLLSFCSDDITNSGFLTACLSCSNRSVVVTQKIGEPSVRKTIPSLVFYSNESVFSCSCCSSDLNLTLWLTLFTFSNSSFLFTGWTILEAITWSSVDGIGGGKSSVTTMHFSLHCCNSFQYSKYAACTTSFVKQFFARRICFWTLILCVPCVPFFHNLFHSLFLFFQLFIQDPWCRLHIVPPWTKGIEAFNFTMIITACSIIAIVGK